MARTGLSLIATDVGPPAFDALHAHLRQVKAADPLAPVTILVPSNYAAVSLRRRLALGTDGPVVEGTSGIAGLHLFTLHRLAETLGGPTLAARGRRPWSSPVLGAAARRALASSPDLFPTVKDHAATEQAVVQAYRELAALDDAARARLRAVDRVAPVVAFHDAMRRRLAGHFYGPSDLVDAATTTAASGRADSLLAGLGSLVVHLPGAMTPAESRLLLAVAERAPVTVIAGLTGDPEADDDVRRALDALRLTPPRETRRPPHIHRVISTSDADDEVRHAVRVVVDAAQRGVPLERIAILYSSPEPYALALDERLTAARLPVNGVSPRRLADSVAGRTLLGLLALPDRDAHLDDLLSLFGSAPLRDRDHRLIPTTAWERLLRDIGVVRNAATRRAELVRHADDLRYRLDIEHETPDDDRAESRRRRLRRRLDQVTALTAFLDDLHADLDRIAAAGTWAGAGLGLRRLVRERLGSERTRQRWPRHEQDAAGSVEAALERLDGLDAIETWPGIDVARRTIELELEDRLSRLGRFGEGLLVGPLSIAAGIDLDIVVIVGAAEGDLPGIRGDDPLLPDHIRQRVRELRPRAVRLGEQHRQFLSALASARVRRVVLYPRGDLRRQADRLPSRWVVRDLARANDRRPDPQDWRAGSVDGFELIPSFVAGLRLTGFPASEQEYDLRSALDHVEAGFALDDHPTLLRDDGLSRSLASLRARSSAAFTAYDGYVTGVVLPDVGTATRPLSPTRLQDYALCPLSYFVRNVLDVDIPDEERRDDHKMSALEAGSVIHDVLEEFFRRRLDPTTAPRPEAPWTDEHWPELDELIDRHSADRLARGRLGHPALWGRHRHVLRTRIRGLLDVDSRRRRSGRQVPVRVEQPFGLPGAPIPAVPLDLGDGRRLHFRGLVDRLDRTEEGRAVVIDYKSGRSDGYRGLSADRPDGSGTLLQLPVYALAARALAGRDDLPVTAEYWFPDDKNIGYDVDDAVLERFRGTVRTLVDSLGDGLFPARPVADGYHFHIPCAVCDPDGLGTRLAHRRWQRKRSDPRLARLVSLVEPDAVAGDRA